MPAPYEEPTPEGGLSVKFCCPACWHVYPVATLTCRGVQLRAKITEALHGGQWVEAERLQLQLRMEVTPP